MERLDTFSDERMSGFCAFCGGGTETFDHVPSRIFLDKPYPEHSPGIRACQECNQGFSLDEEYVACLIEVVVAGSADPEKIRRSKIARTLTQRPQIAARIMSARQQTETGFIFQPENDRVRNVVLKLARGHAAYELSEPQLAEPTSVGFLPLISMTHEQRDAFECIPTPSGWPEIGSRAMQRMAAGWPDVMAGGCWVSVQPERYRYAAVADGGITIRFVIGEYLAAEVRWVGDLEIE
jgi:hypothetical protein